MFLLLKKLIAKIKYALLDTGLTVIRPKVKTISNILISINNSSDLSLFRDIFIYDEYYTPIHLMLKREPKQLNQYHVVDLGANVGFFAIRLIDCLRRFSDSKPQLKLLCIEGSAKNCEEFNRRLKDQNHLFGDYDIQIVHGLVGKKEGEAKLYAGNFHCDHSVFLNAGKFNTVPYIYFFSKI